MVQLDRFKKKKTKKNVKQHAFVDLLLENPWDGIELVELLQSKNMILIHKLIIHKIK